MIINHNLPGMNAIRNMNTNATNASNSMQKLSSGLRINKAGDDAAGLAISEKMRGQIRGLDQASSNSQDAISMIQTAEGGLNETTSILQRMRELAVQSGTDTNTTDDRAKIQSEVDQLAKEITRISNTTEFNSQNLLNGGIKSGNVGELTFQVGANAGQNLSLSINAMDAKTLGVARDAVTGTIGTNSAKLASVEADNGIAADDKLTAGTYNVTVAGVDAGSKSVSTTGSVSQATADAAVTGTATSDSSLTLTYQNSVTASTFSTANVTGGTHTGTGNVTVNGTYSGTSDATLTITQTAAAVTATAIGSATDMTTGSNTGTGGDAQISGNFNGTSNETLTLEKTATGWSVDGGTSDALTDAQVTGGTNTFTYKGMTVDVTNAVTGVATGDTWTQSLTAAKAAEFSVSDGTTTNSNVTSTTTIAGLTVDVSGVSGASNTNTWTQSLTAAGSPAWAVTGTVNGSAYTGTLSGTTNNIGGLNINATALGTPTLGDVINVSGFKDASTTVQLFDNASPSVAIGNAVKIDKANGGTYTIGDSAGAGKLSVSFDAGQATNGSSVVTVGKTNSVAAVFADGQKATDASVSGGIDVSTQKAANKAITVINKAITNVSEERSKLGAYQNRLEHTIANLNTSSENLTSAESRIRDVDMAKEMATFSKNNILAQAAQAMLAQANNQPQQVLQLLR